MTGSSPLLALNWKMNKLPSEAREWAKDLRKELASESISQMELALLPPFVALPAVAEVLVDSGIRYGGQDVSAHPSGAYTGEVSAEMLRDLGATYVVVGHSERRNMHAETSELVALKAKRAGIAGLSPIVCVGEAWDVRSAGCHVEFVLEQLRASLKSVDAANLVIAYEPVWAIGTGQTATVEDAQNMAVALREALREHYGQAGEEIRLLYGGSVSPDNVQQLLGAAEVGGVLVGGASLKLESVLAMLQK